MNLLPILLAIQATSGAASDAAARMTVTPQQLSEALAICQRQIGKPNFDPTELTAAGWPEAIRVKGDKSIPKITGYRHPQNEMLLSLMDFASAPDLCVVMAPFGPSLNREQIEAAVSSLDGLTTKRSGGTVTWTSSTADVESSPMAQAGLRISFKKKVN